jgi:integrase
MCFIYKVDNDLKQEYLSNKPSATAESDSFILRSADEYEYLIQKPIYDMTYTELKEVIMMQFKNSSEKTVLKNISILKTYIDFCINKNVVNHGENRLATFSSKDAKEFVNKQALLSKYITREQLKEYQNVLYNEQDQLFLELPFIGVRGRTTEDGTLEEIINLTINDVDEERKIITLTQNDGTQRDLEVETSTIELIKDVYKQEVYVENNGMETNNPRLSKPREIKINKVENYVFRIPGKDKFAKFTPNLLNSRMRRIQKYLDNMYISYSSLYMSGMLNAAMEIYKEKGELNKEGYIKICDKYNYGQENPEKYWFNLKSLFEQYKELLGIGE